MIRSTVIALLAAFAASAAFARHITFDDLYSLPRCEDPQISPDAAQIVFVRQTADLSANTRQNHLWIMDADGSRTRQLTFGSSAEWRPRWSPDGASLLFLSDRSGEDQVWLLPLDGGEARQVTQAPCGVSEFECSPAGDEVVFVSRVYPDCATDSCQKDRLEYQRNNPNRPRLYEKLPVRRYSRWDDSRVNRLYRARIADGRQTALVESARDIPTSTMGGERDFDISPDGKNVCFVMSLDSMPVLGVNNDLYTVGTAGGQPLGITDNPALDINPRYSPDGRYIAYNATARFGYESDQPEIIIYDHSNKSHQNITIDFDRSRSEMTWDPKSKFIYFTAIDRGFSKIWRINIATHKTELVAGDAVYGDLRISPDSRFLVVNRTLSDSPSELYRCDLNSKTMTRLTHFTEEITDSLQMHRATEFWYPGLKGDSIHGFLTRPPDFDPSRKYPLVLLIHGGPQWCWLGDFNYYGWNTQLTAAQGYVVAQIDPHGSTGYGLEFLEHVSGNWGRGDYEDLMLGIDYLIANYSYIDTTRMGALGRSYGGFMINWICGHTDRFKCLISVDGTYNHFSFYGSTDELWFPEWDIAGTPWSNRDEYVRSSPVTYADQFKTPTMVIHGQLDYRVDISEGLQMFTALQRMGVPSQFLCFPNEGHSTGRLDNLRYVYETQFEWLARWLKP